MRCNNCGWDNDPQSNVCTKCGHLLQVEDMGQYWGVNAPNYESTPDPEPRPTVLDSHQVNPVSRPTKIVNNPISQDQQPKVPLMDSQKKCPHCGYPVMNEATSCPSCGMSFAQEQKSAQEDVSAENPIIGHKNSIKSLGFDIDEKVKCEKCGSEVSIEFSYCPICGERIHLPTIRSIRHKPIAVPDPPKPHCRLVLIPEEDEQVDTIISNDYEGASIIINRGNTEQNNRTITSKEQAELLFEEDKWFLINRSELGSTYLEANRKLELQEGDIVLLGDRRFKFETE